MQRAATARLIWRNSAHLFSVSLVPFSPLGWPVLDWPEYESLWTPEYCFWGQNRSTSWLNHAIGAAAAKARGAQLIVIDPRQAGLANKADLWLRVGLGTDGALALGVAAVMLT